ncbi:MAG: cyclic nucleotide-binding domain-containing protein [Leptospiraceae bacterium]
MDIRELKSQGISLVAVLQQTPLFEQTSTETIKDILREADSESFGPDQVVMMQGEPGDAMYVVLNGKLRARRSGNAVGEINAGEFFGEAALLTDEKRQATVQTVTSCDLIRISKDLFQKVLNKHPEQMQGVASIITRRMQSIKQVRYRPPSTEIVSFLSQLPIFKNIPSPLLRKLEPIVQWEDIPDQELVVEQGSPGDGMYLVYNGRLRWITRDTDGEILREGIFRPGDVFGELSVLTGEPRSATVTTIRDCELIRLSGKSFERLIHTEPRLLLALSRTLATRLTVPKQEQKNPARIFCILPLHPRINTYDFAHKLAQSLPGSAGVMTSTDIPAGAEIEESAESLELNSRLISLEHRHDYTILGASYEDNAWSRKCLRHSDYVILLADAGETTQFSPVELKRLSGGSSHATDPRELILLHSDSNSFKNTANFLSIRKVPHRHIRKTEISDYQRLARSLTGTSVNLVLGGGGARGLAHIGLYKALLECEVPIDSVGGTSFGAIIGAVIALGKQPGEILELVQEFLIDADPMSEYSIPFVSLIRGRRYTNAIKGVCGDANIEDLPIPYFAMAADLTAGAPMVFDRGPLWTATRASSSIPGLAPPILVNDHLLVDGGIVNNVPADVMQERSGGRILAVRVGQAGEVMGDSALSELVAEQGESPALNRVLRNRLRHKKNRIKYPGFGQLVLRSAILGGDDHERISKKSATIWTELPVEQYGLLDWDSAPALIEIGYRHAMTNMEHWKTKLIRHSKKTGPGD